MNQMSSVLDALERLNSTVKNSFATDINSQLSFSKSHFVYILFLIFVRENHLTSNTKLLFFVFGIPKPSFDCLRTWRLIVSSSFYFFFPYYLNWYTILEIYMKQEDTTESNTKQLKKDTKEKKTQRKHE